MTTPLAVGSIDRPPRAPARAAFLAVALVIALLCVVLVARIQGERRAAIAARQTTIASFERRLAVTQLLVDLEAAESAQRGYVIAGSRAFLAPYEPARASIGAELSALEGLYADRSQQEARLRDLRGVIVAKFAEMDEVCRLRDSAGQHDAIARVSDQQGRRLMVRAQAIVAAFIRAEDRELQRSTQRSRERLDTVDHWLMFVVALVAACGVATAIFIWRARQVRFRLQRESWDTVARLRAIFASTSDGILVLNPSGSIETVNAEAVRMLGHTPEALARRDVSTILDIAPGKGCFQERIGIIDGQLKSLLRPDRTAIHRDGHEISVDVALGLMPLEDGVHVVVSLRDVSERRAAERLKDEFVATVSHELRTPLTSVLGALGLLRGGTAGDLPDTARRLIDIAENNSRRLIRLINDILDIDRIGSGRTTLDRSVIDITEIAARALDDARGLAATRTVELVLDAREQPLPTFGDAERLLQVMGNLLSNAIRFSPEGGEVRLSVTREGASVVVAVRDHGPGVPADFRDRIFGRFAQAQAGAAIPGGTGLGLAISREIAKAHGGDIWFEDAEGGGARFCLGLALHVEADAPAPGITPRVLVCEDDPEAADVLREMIEAGGYQSDRCGSAREAQTLARTGRYDGIVVDLHLPDATGLAVVRALRAQSDTRTIPVIVVSAFAGAEGEAPTAHALDVIDWIDKPVDRSRLLRALGHAIRRAADTRPTLLHVDDDPDMLEVTAIGLADRGRMLKASSVAAARELLRHTTPDIVILDINLPDGSGLDLLPDLHAADGTPIPAIVYSASDVVPALDHRFDAVLVKSRRSLSSLSETIGGILSRRRDVPEDIDA